MFPEVRMWLPVQWLNGHMREKLTMTVTSRVIVWEWRTKSRKNVVLLCPQALRW